MPGDRIRIASKQLHVNGRKLDEPYARGKIPSNIAKFLGNTDPIPLGPDEYMVLGDNRNISEGYIKKRAEIIGKVL